MPHDFLTSDITIDIVGWNERIALNLRPRPGHLADTLLTFCFIYPRLNVTSYWSTMTTMLSQFSNNYIFKRVNHCASHKQITQYLERIILKQRLYLENFISQIALKSMV